MTYLKGPWRTERNPYNLSQHIVVAATHQTVVHNVAGGVAYAASNAKLIAAAPSMYELLKRYVADDPCAPGDARSLEAQKIIASIDEETA